MEKFSLDLLTSLAPRLVPLFEFRYRRATGDNLTPLS
jgi:hypothetical protein